MKKIGILLVLVLTLLLTSCKGEELNFGKELVKVNGMVDILTELDTKSSDVGIMDSIMAGYYINQQYKGKLTIVKDVVVAEEEYGIAARRDGAYTAKMISKTIIDLAKDGTRSGSKFCRDHFSECAGPVGACGNRTFRFATFPLFEYRSFFGRQTNARSTAATSATNHCFYFE